MSEREREKETPLNPSVINSDKNQLAMEEVRHREEHVSQTTASLFFVCVCVFPTFFLLFILFANDKEYIDAYRVQTRRIRKEVLHVYSFCGVCGGR